MILHRVLPFYNPSKLHSSPPVNGFRSNFVHVFVDKFMTERSSYVGQKTESKSNHCYFSMHTVFTTTHYRQDKKNQYTQNTKPILRMNGTGFKKTNEITKHFAIPFMRRRKLSEHDC